MKKMNIYIILLFLFIKVSIDDSQINIDKVIKKSKEVYTNYTIPCQKL